MLNVQESALALLLRSPRLSVSRILDLLDVSERDFRKMMRQDETIAQLIHRRQKGLLEPASAEPRRCPVCEDWYLPYASARQCSDACARTAAISKE